MDVCGKEYIKLFCVLSLFFIYSLRKMLKIEKIFK